MGIHLFGLILLAVLIWSPSANAQALSTPLIEAQHNCLHSRKLHAIGSDDQALNFANKAIQLAPNQAEFHLWKAELLFDTQDDDPLALAEANKACSLGANAWSQCLRAHLLLRLHRLPEALSAVNKSIELGPGMPNFRIKAEILMAIGRLQEAEDCLGEAQKRFGANQDIRIDRAKVGANLKHWSLVREECNQIILAQKRTLHPKLKIDVQAHLLRALASFELKQTDQAKKEYLAALARWPDSREVHIAVLNFFKKTGDTKSAEMEKQSLQKFDQEISPL